MNKPPYAEVLWGGQSCPQSAFSRPAGSPAATAVSPAAEAANKEALVPIVKITSGASPFPGHNRIGACRDYRHDDFPHQQAERGSRLTVTVLM
jgi:hypothetical protein